MIIVNVNKTSPGHVVRDSASSAWLIAEWRLNRYGDYLVAVERNVVVGVFSIRSWERLAGPKSGVVFSLTEAARDIGIAVGDPSPDPWLAGQRWPVKYLATEAWLARTAERQAVSLADVLVPGLSVTLDGDGVVTLAWDADRLASQVEVGADNGKVVLRPRAA